MAGRTVRLAVAEGFKHAMNAIVDSNVATVLTALFLFQFGTGPVKGFAVTLIMGIAASMVTAVFVTKTFFLIWLERRPDRHNAEHLTMTRIFANANYDFIGFRRKAILATITLFVIGVIALFAQGLNYSIEFTGGTLVEVVRQGADRMGQLRTALNGAGITSPRSRRSAARTSGTSGPAGGPVGEPRATPPPRRTPSRQGTHQVIGASKYSVRAAGSVGPKVGRDLRAKAFLAIFLSFFAVLAYLAYRFEWRFGLAAVLRRPRHRADHLLHRRDEDRDVAGGGCGRAVDGGLLAQ